MAPPTIEIAEILTIDYSQKKREMVLKPDIHGSIINISDTPFRISQEYPIVIHLPSEKLLNDTSTILTIYGTEENISYKYQMDAVSNGYIFLEKHNSTTGVTYNKDSIEVSDQYATTLRFKVDENLNNIRVFDDNGIVQTDVYYAIEYKYYNDGSDVSETFDFDGFSSALIKYLNDRADWDMYMYNLSDSERAGIPEPIEPLGSKTSSAYDYYLHIIYDSDVVHERKYILDLIRQNYFTPDANVPQVPNTPFNLKINPYISLPSGKLLHDASTKLIIYGATYDISYIYKKDEHEEGYIFLEKKIESLGETYNSSSLIEEDDNYVSTLRFLVNQWKGEITIKNVDNNTIFQSLYSLETEYDSPVKGRFIIDEDKIHSYIKPRQGFPINTEITPMSPPLNFSLYIEEGIDGTPLSRNYSFKIASGDGLHGRVSHADSSCSRDTSLYIYDN